jgi:hypothetical protein
MPTPVKLLTVKDDDWRNMEAMVIWLAFAYLNKEPLEPNLPAVGATVNNMLKIGREASVTWETK